MAIDWDAYRKKAKQMDEEEARKRKADYEQRNAAKKKTLSAPEKRISTVQTVSSPLKTTTSVTKNILRDERDIAPVMKTFEPKKTAVTAPVRKETAVAKAILGTVGDVAMNAASGATSYIEGITDAVGYGAADVAEKFGKGSLADRIREQTKKSYTQKLFGDAIKNYGEHSLSGDFTDSLAQGLGQVGTMTAGGALLGAAGLAKGAISALTTGATALSGYGSGAGQAYEGGATDEEAKTYGMIAGASEALTELLFGGLGKMSKALGHSKGLLSVDDMLAKKISNLFSNQIVKNLAEYGVKSSAEGFEEVLSGIAQAVGKKITYMKDEDFKKILKDEKLLEQYLVGMTTSAIMQSGDLVKSTAGKTDFITGLDQKEQAVVDKEVENRIAEREKDGKKLSKKDKDKIYDEAIKALDEGDIDTETIESVLGGETYKTYKDTVEREDAILKKFEELGNKTDATLKEQAEFKKVSDMAEELKKADKRGELKKRLSDEVSSLVKDSRLSESYNEKARRREAFKADLSKYDEKQQEVIKKAAESGILNNTRKTHKFVDLIARISADKGVSFDFTSNEKLKESGFAIEGKTVNGLVTKDGIQINVNSAKALNTVVGHEVAHIFEGTALYSEMQRIVKAAAVKKGEYQSRYDEITKLYEGIKDADIEKELTADLVGDYLFTDEDFIRRLSTENRSIFTKIRDEINYLCRVAAAGSAEARKLEQAKKLFEKVYRESEAKINTTDEGGVRYSLSNENKRFSYTSLVSKSDMELSIVDDSIIYNATKSDRKKVIDKAIENVKAVGRINENGNAVVNVKDIDTDVIVSRKSIEHGLDRRLSINGAVAEKIGSILKNSIKINELIPSKDSASSSYVLIGAAKNKNGNIFIVRSVVNSFDNELDKIDVLYAVQTKKESAVLNEPALTDEPLRITDSSISISKLLEYVNKYFTDILPEDVLKHYGHTSRPEGVLGASALYSLGEKKNSYGSYNVYGEDVMLEGKVKSAEDPQSAEIITPTAKKEITAPMRADVNPLKNEQVENEEHAEEVNTDTVRTVSDKITAKLKHSQEELENNKKLLEKSKADFDAKISELQAEYDSKKNKDTKVANNILRRIEVLKRKKGNIEADYQKRISDIEKRIPKLEKALENSYKTDSLETFKIKTTEQLTADKRALRAEYEKNRAELEGMINDKSGYVSSRARALYDEMNNLRKGVRASNELGYFLDLFGKTEWNELKSTFLKVSKWPDTRLSESSAVENSVREALIQDYEDMVEIGMDELDMEYGDKLKKLEEDAQKRVEDFKASELTRTGLHKKIVDGIKAKFTEKGLDFDKALKNAKNLGALRLNDNTPQRAMEKTLGPKQGQILADATVNKVAQNETEAIKWLNSYLDRKTGILAQISKQYGIKPGSKESAAAQKYAEGFYVDEKHKDKPIYKYDDAQLAKEFPDLDVQKKIRGLATDERIRKIYDETLELINESRKRNLYPEIPRRDNYFLHFRAMSDTFSTLGLPFNPNDIRAKDLPTDINGITADLKPGQPYFPSANERKGIRTSFDLLGGLEQYLTSAKNQIYHIDDIQNLRALRNYIADTFGQAKGLDSLDTMSEEEAEYRIKQVYDSHLSNFARFLNEEANVLAGKTALIDRGLEGFLGRRGMTFLNTLNKQVGANMVGFNISSSLTNFLPVAQTFAKTSKRDFTKAFAQTVSNKVSTFFRREGDGFSEASPVIIRRKGAEQFYRKPYQKIADAGYALMSAVDNISTELIARTKFNELTRKGMDEQQAHFETDKWVSRLMGDRSIGQQPLLYNSKLLGMLTKFQLEVRNQLDSQFYDTIQEIKVSNEEIESKLKRNAKTAAKVTSVFFQLAAVQHLYGTAFEKVAGYNPAFDIIDVLIKTFGFDDDEEDEDTVLDNVEEGFFALLEDLPYTSTFTGGRIPISSALPIREFVKGEDEYGNEKSRWETFTEAAPYYVLPGGYGQIKKSAQGLKMFDDDLPIAGSYTDSGKLRFPAEETFGSVLRAAVFGQYASKNARTYFNEDHDSLNEKQIQEFKDLDLPISDYWEIREGLARLEPEEGKKQVTLNQKGDYIGSLDLPTSKKNILINNIAGRETPIDMKTYDKYENFEEFDFATKDPEKYKVLQEQGISVREYKEKYEKSVFMYTDDFSWAAQNPEQYTLSKAVTNNVTEYRKYTGALYDIKADKDSKGNSISGSAKRKKKEYIWSLDLDQGAKYVLFRKEYQSDDTYNYEIIDYINKQKLSYDEKKTALEELGFMVDSKGRITWN